MNDGQTQGIDIGSVGALLALMALGDTEAAAIQMRLAVEAHPQGAGGFIHDLCGAALMGQQAVAAGLNYEMTADDLAFFWQQWANASAAE